jgi:hypothetical protein
MALNRMLWAGGDYSRMNVDSFKMLDTTRLFFLEDYSQAAGSFEGSEADKIAFVNKTNTAGGALLRVEKGKPVWDTSAIATDERVVIDPCPCAYCLSDRPPLLSSPEYNEIAEQTGTPHQSITINQYFEYLEKIIRGNLAKISGKTNKK